MTLRNYFQDRNLAESALTHYLHFARSADWRIGTEYGKLHLYRLGANAFDPNFAPNQVEGQFHIAYELVRSWPGVQRGGQLADSSEAFRVLRPYAGNIVGTTELTLATLTDSSQTQISLFLEKLHFIKPNRRYPWMAVSKVLHFCNPALFPIWDWEVVWNTVMSGTGRFSRDYSRFCNEHGFAVGENGAVFLFYYALWAAEHIQNADEEFMQWFGEWMQNNFAKDIRRYDMEDQLTSLYATAFEFVAIGASRS